MVLEFTDYSVNSLRVATMTARSLASSAKARCCCESGAEASAPANCTPETPAGEDRTTITVQCKRNGCRSASIDNETLAEIRENAMAVDTSVFFAAVHELCKDALPASTLRVAKVILLSNPDTKFVDLDEEDMVRRPPVRRAVSESPAISGEWCVHSTT